MNQTTYTLLGVMSGTSLDGVDFAYAKFYKDEFWHYELLDCATVPYTPYWVERLKDAVDAPAEDLKLLDADYTRYLGGLIEKYTAKNPIDHLDAVASHGHTILHRPEAGITYQIGNLPALAHYCKERVICDFRVEDVALGGQGAPLVPVGDELLFSNFAACLNIGGFANVSLQKAGKRIAYDICPTNIVLNHFARKLHKEYDKDGAIAAAGRVDENVLDRLNALAFYKQDYPKSLGLEWVKTEVFPILNDSGLSVEAVIATYTEHMAIQIAEVLKSVKLQQHTNGILITGGGAYNTHLINRLKQRTQIALEVPDPKIIEFKEALIFAFMGALRLRNAKNVLKSVTGASRDHCAGIVYSP